jgi:outer membrane protein assembly factor BamD
MDPGAGVRRLCCAAALGAMLAGCATGQPDIATLTSNSDQAIWDAGQKALSKKDWISARQHFRRIIDGFPQSPHAAEARLAVGETYVGEGGSTNDLLAVGAYREFLTLYPSHPKSDYAQFQVGEAYFRRRNGPDRDQTDTREAVAEFQRLLDLYPQSPYAEQARARITEARQSLARAEFLAGYFYRLAECLQASGRGAEALPHLGRLVEEYPKSSWVDPAKQLMAAAAAAPPVPSPVPQAPSPAPEKPGASPSPAS